MRLCSIFYTFKFPEGRAEYFSRGMESNIDHPAAAQVLVFDGEKCLGLAEITDKKAVGTETGFKSLNFVQIHNLNKVGKSIKAFYTNSCRILD